MASGMKVWLMVCLGGIAAAAVLLLPVRSAEEIARGRSADVLPRPAAEALMRLESEAAILNGRIQRLRVQDTLDARIAAAAAAGERVFADFTPATAGSDEAAVFMDTLRAVAERDDVILGVVFLDRDYGSALPEVRSTVDEFYAGRAPDGTPYCVRVDRMYRDDPDYFEQIVRWSGLGPLGLCSWWARFGPPGEHVDRWIRAGAYSYATESAAPEDYYARIFGQVEAFGLYTAPILQSTSGQRFLATSSECANGPVERCAALALDTTLFRHDPAYRTGSRRYAPVFHDARAHTDLVGSWLQIAPVSIVSGHFIAEIERHEGSDALARFWGSDLPVDEAFEEAVGTSVGPWIRDWILRAGYSRTEGPTMRRSTAGLSLLAMLLAAGLAFTVHRRREVG